MNKINAGFGFKATEINGLTVYTLTVRFKQHSTNHMAFWYVTNVENICKPHKTSVRQTDKGTYVTQRFATADSAEFNNLFKIMSLTQGYVLQHEADKKLGTKTAPDFEFYYRHHNNTSVYDLSDELPF